MSKTIYNYLSNEINTLKSNGLYKKERIIASPQQAVISLADGSEVINLCANNYLGLADHPTLIECGQKALEQYGYGLSSVRFICGTQTIHKELEKRLADFLGKQDAILYSSCFDANGGLFEPLLNEEDALISDALNHASIIDGIRLCKAKRYVYPNNDMESLETHLKEASSARFRLIATDGVFSMDGSLAKLDRICELAQQYDALVMVDDSHAIGFMGEHGAGTPDYYGVTDQIDILTGTLGKALGGASGGYTAAKTEIVTWLRQRSRPYLFSNTLAPVVAAVSIETLKLIEKNPTLRNTLHENSAYFRTGLTKLGFYLLPGEHPIIPVMIGDAKLASQMADALLHEGIYVVGFSFPVVPHGKARIRTQMSAAHTKAHLDKALAAFEKIGRSLGIIK
jgi:glycine C-acetyltransferase